ncbi:unnamed protein product, partial [Meganyctiphanes norvegica]
VMSSRVKVVLLSLVAVASAQLVRPQEGPNRGFPNVGSPALVVFTPASLEALIRQQQRKALQQPLQGCGISAEVPIGGTLGEGEQWPWVASIIYNRTRVCAAALVSSRHLLTAAHCFDALPGTTHNNEVWVRLGSADLNDGDRTLNDYTISREIIHPGYESATLENDLAIITLEKDVTFSNTVRPVCFPESIQSYEGNMATILGSGKEAAAAAAVGAVAAPIPRTVLEAAQLLVWNNQECQGAHQHPIRDTHICAGRKVGEINVCKGDSGGPMVVNGPQGWSVIGLVSWASRGGICGQPGEPVVYTRISEYMSWINNKIV